MMNFLRRLLWQNVWKVGESRYASFNTNPTDIVVKVTLPTGHQSHILLTSDEFLECRNRATRLLRLKGKHNGQA